MEYQFQNTTKNIDALKLSKDRWLRIEESPDYAKEVLINGCKYADVIRNIKKDSYCVVRNLLEVNQINHIKNKVLSNIKNNLSGMKVRDHTKETHSKKMEIFHRTLDKNDTLETAKKITNGISVKDPLIAIPSIIDVIQNSFIQGVVTGYYESIPQLTFTKARISFCDSIGPRDTQFWHCDPGSYRVLKVLIYLNDVDLNGGPFEIISGTHFNKFEGWDSITRHDDQELKEIYDKNLFKKITAKVGDIIFADATAFHRGNVPITKDRLILILNFCVHDEYGLPYQKVKIKKDIFNEVKGISSSILKNLEIVD